MLDNPRAIAAATLAEVMGGKAFHGESLVPCAKLSHQDQAFFRELCFGSLRYYHNLNAQLSQRLRKPLDKADLDIYCLLLVGIYQLLYLRTPDHAAISATVDASRALNKGWASGLVNGVLRSVQREPELENESPSALYSHPDWLLKQLQRDWPEQWEDIIHCNNQTPSMSLRLNEQHSDRDNYLATWAEQASLPMAQACPISVNGIRLAQAIEPERIPGFNEGKVSIQDSGAQLAAELLPLDEGSRVLDACAAPGGKAAHLLERYPTIDLVALDIDAQRVERIHSTMQRLQLKARIIEADATATATWWDKQLFDAILLDAPCSGSGVIRKHPDIKLLRKKRDIRAFAEQQLALLNALWPLLAKGGTFLYCTCSVLRDENEQVIQHFLERHADACEQPIEADWGIPCAVGRQLLPADNGNDGFFYARLIKQAQV